MTQLNLALAVTGAAVVLIGLFSKPIKKSLVQEPILAVLLGVAVGPQALGWLDVASWGDQDKIIEQAARITLAIGLMGVALRLKREGIRILLRPVLVLLTVGMLGMWLLSAGLAGWLLGLGLWTALLVGAAVTPTDPVVASSLVTGPFAKSHLPLRVRDSLSFEAGANDGLAYAFVMLPIMMLQHAPGEGLHAWLIESLLVGVGLGALVGTAVGWAAAWLLRFAQERHEVEKVSLLGYTVAFALATLGASELLGGDALISVFLAGLVFNLRTDRMEEHEEKHIQEAVAKLFTLPMFVLFGLVLPWEAWARLGWPLLALVLLIPLLRRPPVMALMWPALRRRLNAADCAFLGWFGPVGVAGIFYAAMAKSHLDDPVVWGVSSAVVFGSILIHGVTAAPLTRLCSRTAGPGPKATARMES